jgi:hypothetical protein
VALNRVALELMNQSTAFAALLLIPYLFCATSGFERLREGGVRTS